MTAHQTEKDIQEKKDLKKKIQVASRVKRFCAFHRAATLSTISCSVNSYPFGSLVPYDINQNGEIIIFISLISEHYKNIQENPKASIFIRDEYAISNPQSHGRACIIGEFIEVKDQEIKDSYRKRFPNSSSHTLAHNFRFYKLQIERVRWIGGFGEIRWVEKSDFEKAPFDEIAYIGQGICDHMNYDHKDSLPKLVQKKNDEVLNAEFLFMNSISNSGFEIRFKNEDEERRISFNFPQVASATDEVRKMIIEMIRA